MGYMEKESASKLDELLSIPERAFHRGSGGDKDCYGIAPETVRFIHANVAPGDVTLETGAGNSTIGFVAAGANHTAVSLFQHEGDRVKEFLSANGVDRDFRFIAGSSDVVLANLEYPDSLDFVFIDGAHRFPYAILDWHFTERHIPIGGFLGVDDYKMPSVRFLVEFLTRSDEWSFNQIVQNTVFFKRLSEWTPRGDWLAQNINYPDLSWKADRYPFGVD